VRRVVVAAPSLQCLPQLARHRPSEHVQDLVPVIAQPAQALRRRPHLWRIPADQLTGDDLVERHVQARVDLLAANHRGLATVRDCRVELRVGRADQQGTIVRVGGIEELDLDPVRRVVDRRDGEGEALSVVGVR
jgi:hypothetical protein